MTFFRLPLPLPRISRRTDPFLAAAAPRIISTGVLQSIKSADRFVRPGTTENNYSTSETIRGNVPGFLRYITPYILRQ